MFCITYISDPHSITLIKLMICSSLFLPFRKTVMTHEGQFPINKTWQSLSVNNCSGRETHFQIITTSNTDTKSFFSKCFLGKLSFTFVSFFDEFHSLWGWIFISTQKDINVISFLLFHYKLDFMKFSLFTDNCQLQYSTINYKLFFQEFFFCA